MKDTELTMVLARLTECGQEEGRQALDILRQRHPEYLPRVWRELMAGGGLSAGATLPIRKDRGLLTQVGNPPPMLIEGLLPDKSLFLLSGKPKAGKSFLALDIAYAVQRGEKVFDTHTVNRPGPVVYLCMEDGEFEIANRLLARGVKKDEGVDGIDICTERFALSDPEKMDWLREQLEPLAPSLLIVDTAAEALGIKDWLNRSEITDKVGMLRDLARQVCAVLLVSHNRKSDGDCGDEIAGSNAFTGAVDGWISAYKVEALPSGNRRMYLRTEGRGGVRGELAVEMNTKTLHFTALTSAEAAAGKEDAAGDEWAAKIARAIEDFKGKATVKQISELLEWPYSTVARHVKTLVASGFLADTGERRIPVGGGIETSVYRLA